MGLDYYRVLFINKDATEEEVKQGYKRMALLHHPTRQRVERPVSPSLRAKDQMIREQQRQLDSIQVFYLVSEAYDVLGNPVNRAIFDLYGERGLKEGMPSPNGFIPPYAYHGDPYRTFKEFFSTDNPYKDLLATACVPIDFFAGSDNQNQDTSDSGGGDHFKVKQAPIKRDLLVTLEDLYCGCLKKVMIFKRTISPEGHTMEVTEKVLTIDIQPGTPDQSQFTFPGEGDQGDNIQPADVIFVTQVAKHPLFTREGDNLIMTKSVNLCDSLTGHMVPIEMLDGRKFNVNIVHIISPGYEKVVVNEGMPIFGQKGKRGDLIIRFNVNYPMVLTTAQRKKAKEALCPSGGEKYTPYTKSVPQTLKNIPKVSCVCKPDQPPEAASISPAAGWDTSYDSGFGKPGFSAPRYLTRPVSPPPQTGTTNGSGWE